MQFSIYFKRFRCYVNVGIFAGGCINASPAGKRRIANGIEQQQFGDDSLFGISGKMNIVNNDGSPNGGLSGRFSSTTAAITSIAIAACVLIISLFAIIFVVLQVSAFESICMQKYKKELTNLWILHTY